GGARGLGSGAGLREGGVVALALGLDAGGFLGEARDHLAGVAVEGGFAAAVGLDLGEGGLQCCDLAGQLFRLAIEAIALQGGALEDGGGDGVFLAQGGQALVGFNAQAGGLGGLGLGGGGGAQRGGESLGGSGA